LKEEALDHIKWRNRFGRGCGPVVWQITDDDDINAVGTCWLCYVKIYELHTTWGLCISINCNNWQGSCQ
jgi:hypothetical protein